jgi:hypothetical protein
VTKDIEEKLAAGKKITKISKVKAYRKAGHNPDVTAELGNPEYRPFVKGQDQFCLLGSDLLHNVSVVFLKIYYYHPSHLKTYTSFKLYFKIVLKLCIGTASGT